jgi:hypothetical protein
LTISGPIVNLGQFLVGSDRDALDGGAGAGQSRCGASARRATSGRALVRQRRGISVILTRAPTPPRAQVRLRLFYASVAAPGAGGGRHSLAARGGAAAAASFVAAVLTEIYLCTVCSCHDILGRNGRGQARAPPRSSGRWPRPRPVRRHSGGIESPWSQFPSKFAAVLTPTATQSPGAACCQRRGARSRAASTRSSPRPVRVTRGGVSVTDSVLIMCLLSITLRTDAEMDRSVGKSQQPIRF